AVHVSFPRVNRTLYRLARVVSQAAAPYGAGAAGKLLLPVSPGAPGALRFWPFARTIPAHAQAHTTRVEAGSQAPAGRRQPADPPGSEGRHYRRERQWQVQPVFTDPG